MPVRIPHRFFNRLTYAGQARDLNIIIVGTFNPGEPANLDDLPIEHANALSTIFATNKYRQFSQIRNFYDRPQNRFWGIMDRINAPACYRQNGQNYINRQGLKFYKGGNRDQVHIDQTATEFNTAHLVHLLQHNREIHLLLNIGQAGALQNISVEINKLIAGIEETRIHYLPSTSGQSYNSYQTLFPSWNAAINLRNPNHRLIPQP